MGKKSRYILLGLLPIAALALVVWYFHHTQIAVLSPEGPVAAKERHLIYFVLGLSLIVVIPVYVLTILFAWRYREGNRKAKYSPELDGNLAAETTWWLIPSVLILVFAVVAWRSSHQLDPFKALSSDKKPMTIQAVAMNWKWLFIYPQQHIASVNYLSFPTNTPINFQITSDAPMNSFWIPQLGGQIYAMAGMSTQLHLEATQAGDFQGSSANISGRGFAGMRFIAHSGSEADFNTWVKQAKSSNRPLDLAAYNKLAAPSINNSVTYYSSEQGGLYGNIVDRYMMPGMEAYIQ